jgi:hypothetical protein
LFPGRGPSGRPKEQADAHLILINPDILHEPPIFVMSVLVHEQCHLWRQVLGTPIRLAHDAQWAAKMMEVDLMPSRPGHPGGRQTGHRMVHHVIPDGRFERAFHAMPPEHLFPWRPRD